MVIIFPSNNGKSEVLSKPKNLTFIVKVSCFIRKVKFHKCHQHNIYCQPNKIKSHYYLISLNPKLCIIFYLDKLYLLFLFSLLNNGLFPLCTTPLFTLLIFNNNNKQRNYWNFNGNLMPLTQRSNVETLRCTISHYWSPSKCTVVL